MQSIDDRFRTAGAGFNRYVPVVDPATEMPVAEAPDGNKDDVDAAVVGVCRAIERPE